jgi:hypothetical protein
MRGDTDFTPTFFFSVCLSHSLTLSLFRIHEQARGRDKNRMFEIDGGANNLTSGTRRSSSTSRVSGHDKPDLAAFE